MIENDNSAAIVAFFVMFMGIFLMFYAIYSFLPEDKQLEVLDKVHIPCFALSSQVIETSHNLNTSYGAGIGMRCWKEKVK